MPVIETLGLVVGFAGVLQPAFQACRDLWKGWRLTQAFGDDLGEQRRNLDIQMTLLDEVSKRKLRHIRNKQLDPLDENNEVTRRIVDLLVNMRMYFAECDRLIKKNTIPEILGDRAASVSPELASIGINYSDNASQPVNVATDLVDSHGLSQGHFIIFNNQKPPEVILPIKESRPSSVSLRKLREKFHSVTRRREMTGNKPPKHTDETGQSKKGHLRVTGPQWSSSSSTSHHPGSSAGSSVSIASRPSEAVTPLTDTEIRDSSSSRTNKLDTSRPIDFSRSSRSPTPVTETGSRNPVSSVLDSQRIISASARADLQAAAVDEANSFGRKVVWAADDLDLLDKQIAKLWTANQVLGSLLELEAPEMLEHVLGDQKSADARLQNLALVQDNLLRLHESLASTNGRLPAQSVEISLHLTANHEQQTQDFLTQEDELQFRDHSMIFFLQMKIPALENESLQVVSEATPVIDRDASDSLPRVSSLYERLTRDIVSAKEGYIPLGSVSRQGSPLDSHHLFYACDTTWSSSTTLAQEISREQFRDTLNPIQRSQLASLLAISHLHVAKIRPICGLPQPANFCFYHERGTEQVWCNDEPYVLNPWLCFGFGSRKPKRNVAASSGINRKTCNPVIWLGLLLFQIGSCTTVDYGIGTDGFRRARDVALRSMEDVEIVSGPNFAEAVTACLQFRDNPFDAVTREEEELVVRHVIRWLELLEQQLERYES